MRNRDERKDGGSAFPFSAIDGSWDQDGMTLRDYFAAKALTQWWIDRDDADRVTHGEVSDQALDIVAAYCYRMADAMLKAREAK